MKKHLVFVGAGHAHLTCLKNIQKFRDLGVEVSVISSNEFLYYSGMGPGLLSGIYKPEEVRFNVKRLTEQNGGTFIENEAVKLDLEDNSIQLVSGDSITYDIVSFNIGSVIDIRPLQILSNIVLPVKPIDNLEISADKILELARKRVINLHVIGGGAAGTEITGNLWRLLQENNLKGNITLLSNERLLARFPKKVRAHVVASFKDRGIDLIEDNGLNTIKDKTIVLEDGSYLDSDFIFLATGIRISSLFKDSGLSTTEDGALLVNSFLQSVDCPNLFGGGDCVSLVNKKLDKVGVYAVRENPILLSNLLNYIKGKPMKAFNPQSHYLLILNLGNGKGIAWRKKRVFKSRLAFCLKNYIDQRFMNKFQS